MGEADVKAVVAGMAALARVVHAERPDLPPGYLTVARAGWLRMGVGGALADKILIAFRGHLRNLTTMSSSKQSRFSISAAFPASNRRPPANQRFA